MALITLTNRIGVFPAEAAASLKLIEKGMQRVWLTSLKLFYFPIEMMITIIMTRVLSTHNPLTLMQRCYLARISMALLLTCFIHFLPGRVFSFGSSIDAEIEAMEAKYYPIAAVLVVLSGAAAQCMNVSAV